MDQRRTGRELETEDDYYVPVSQLRTERAAGKIYKTLSNETKTQCETFHSRPIR